MKSISEILWWQQFAAACYKSTSFEVLRWIQRTLAWVIGPRIARRDSSTGQVAKAALVKIVRGSFGICVMFAVLIFVGYVVDYTWRQSVELLGEPLVGALLAGTLAGLFVVLATWGFFSFSTYRKVNNVAAAYLDTLPSKSLHRGTALAKIEVEKLLVCIADVELKPETDSLKWSKSSEGYASIVLNLRSRKLRRQIEDAIDEVIIEMADEEDDTTIVSHDEFLMRVALRLQHLASYNRLRIKE